MAKQILSLDQRLHAVPVQNQRIAIQVGKGSGITVEVELVYPAWLRSVARLLRFRRKRSFLLDAMGQELYCAIDGKRSVEDLIDTFAAEHKLTFFEARAFLAKYLQTLMKNGLIAMGVPREDQSSGNAR